MKFKCEVDNVRTLKKGMKITLAIDEDDTKEVMKNIYNFMDKSVSVDLLVDEEKELEKMNWITGKQRKKIFALIKDIANHIVEDKESVREQVTDSFLRATEYEEFSLSNCSKQVAKDFIDYLITLSFEIGAPLSDNPIEGLEDIESYLQICIDKKKCCVCGLDGEIHHCTGSRIGMGNDRTRTSNKGRELISLCREHHTEIHSMPEEEFFEKYHVSCIVYE